jgi:hypothetical protein
MNDYEWSQKCDFRCDEKEGGHSHFSTLARDICKGIRKSPDHIYYIYLQGD